MAATHGDSRWEYRVKRHPMIPDQFLVQWREKGQQHWLSLRSVISLNRASSVMRAHKRWLTSILRRTGHGGS